MFANYIEQLTVSSTYTINLVFRLVATRKQSAFLEVTSVNLKF